MRRTLILIIGLTLAVIYIVALRGLMTAIDAHAQIHDGSTSQELYPSLAESRLYGIGIAGAAIGFSTPLVIALFKLIKKEVLMSPKPIKKQVGKSVLLITIQYLLFSILAVMATESLYLLTQTGYMGHLGAAIITSCLAAISFSTCMHLTRLVRG